MPTLPIYYTPFVAFVKNFWGFTNHFIIIYVRVRTSELCEYGLMRSLISAVRSPVGYVFPTRACVIIMKLISATLTCIATAVLYQTGGVVYANINNQHYKSAILGVFVGFIVIFLNLYARRPGYISCNLSLYNAFWLVLYKEVTLISNNFS